MVTKNAIDSNIPIEIAKGGTNATTMTTSLGIVKFDGTRQVTSSTATLDANNVYTNTSQPMFSAYLASEDNNVTGDGTNYFVGTNVAFTEIFDIGNNFNTNGTFTCPVTSKVLLHASLLLQQVFVAANITVQIVTSNRSYIWGNTPGAPFVGNFPVVLTAIADMDAGDTATFLVCVSAGTKVVDIYGGANDLRTFFQGAILG